MAIPEVYAGFGTGKGKGTNNVTDLVAGKNPSINDTSILSGPDWFDTLTKNGTITQNSTNRRWFCLDLLKKYHNNSKLKRFHALTFYFRNSDDDSLGAIITSMLPESFTYSIGGNYTNPIQMGGGEFVNAVFQEITKGNKSLSFNLDTSLVWQSPQRMDVVFKIPVFDDSGSGTHRNYQEAIELFGQAILPEVDKTGLYTSTPGPSVITMLNYKATEGTKTLGAAEIDTMRTNAFASTREKIAKEAQYNEWDENKQKNATKNAGESSVFFANQVLFGGTQTKRWDRISVQVGGLLLLDWCVIKQLKVTFPNTKAQVLHDFRRRNPVTKVLERGEPSYEGSAYDYKVHLQPIQAELEVTVSTVMGITRATFKDMLYQNETERIYAEEENNNTSKTKDTKTGQQENPYPTTEEAAAKGVKFASEETKDMSFFEIASKAEQGDFDSYAI